MLQLIGDPHLGREFVNGIAIERRGEREESQYKQFAELLVPKEGTTRIVMVGDLFDKFQVKNEVLMRTFDILAAASYANPDCLYYMMMGNHDVSRDVERISSFDVLASMCSHLENLTFVTTPLIILEPYLLLMPYSAFATAQEALEAQVSWLPTEEKYEAVIGHWDTVSFGGSDHNLIPLELLSTITDTVYTGHIHTPSVTGIVNVIGSMQPYSHGEDPTCKIYCTLSLEEFNALPAGALHDSSVRLKLKPGETMPDNIDVWQIQVLNVSEDTNEEELEVQLETFSMQAIFKESLKNAGVDEDTTNTVWDEYTEVSHVETT